MKKFLAVILSLAMLFSLAMPAAAAEDSTTIYFENTAVWATVNAYAFDAENNAYLGQWPGTAMTYVEGNIWSVAVPAGATTIIFNYYDGTTGEQTADLTIPTDGNNLYTYNGNWSVYTPAPKTKGDVTATFDPEVSITGISLSGDAVRLNEDGTYTVVIPVGEESVQYTETIAGVNLEYYLSASDVLLSLSNSINNESSQNQFSLSQLPEGHYVDGKLVGVNSVGDEYTIVVKYSNDSGVTWNDGYTMVAKRAYSITNNTASNANGTITVPESAVEGDIITPVINPADGYALDTLTVTDAEDRTVDVTDNSFTMPSSNITVTATFKDATSYGITVNTDGNGTIFSDKEQATAGTTVTLTVTPATGYVLDTLTVNGDMEANKVDDTTYTFVMPEADVTVSATFRQPAAEITGVTITIDGTVYNSSNTSVQNPAVITKDTQSITLTVSGKDFALLTDSYYVGYASGASMPITEDYVFEIDTANNIATKDFSENVSDFQNSTEVFEIYYNNNSAEDTYSGLYIIYQDNTEYSITLDENIANGALTANPTSAKAGTLITLTWTADAGYAIENITVTDSDGSEVSFEDQGLTKWTFIMPASNVNVTATFYKMPISSVEITWGSMSFTYDDSLVDGIEDTEVGWKNDGSDGAGSVTVKNIGENGISMTISYTAETGYTEIEGYFYDASQNINYSGTASADLDAEVSKMFELYLEGKPEKAIPAGTKIGVVTIVIESSESNTEQGSDISVPSESA